MRGQLREPDREFAAKLSARRGRQSRQRRDNDGGASRREQPEREVHAPRSGRNGSFGAVQFDFGERRFDAPELPAAAFAPRKFEHPLFRFGRLEVELGTQAAEGGVEPVVPVHLAAVGAQREGAGCIQQLFAPLMGAGKDDAAQPDRLGEAEGHAAGFALAPAPDRRIADHVARLHAG